MCAIAWTLVSGARESSGERLRDAFFCWGDKYLDPNSYLSTQLLGFSTNSQSELNGRIGFKAAKLERVL